MSDASAPEAVTHSANNFDGLRLLAALAVILGHAVYLTGRDRQSVPSIMGDQIQDLGVAVFLIISGYLISGSWERAPRLGSYLRARALRILPGLAAVTVITTFVIGPLVTTFDAGQYFASDRTWVYLTNAVLHPVYDLPGVFVGMPYVDKVNGVFWTLPVEAACYLIVPLAALLPARFRNAAMIVLLVAGVTIWVATRVTGSQAEVDNVPLRQIGAIWPYFAIGALLRTFPIRFDIAGLIFVAGLVLVQVVPPHDQQVILWIALPPFVLAIGTARTVGFHRAARFGDLSYGLYLWGFLVQQLIILKLGVLPFAVNCAIVLVITGALAWVSWHLVEKRALRLKHRPPAPVTQPSLS
jgi:peptidoglycan/LPS O-acetylase OafA/YrhL